MSAAPGIYSSLSMSNKTCVEIHCAVAANVGEAANPNGCRVSGQTDIQSVKNATIEGFVFATTEDYGIAVYDESPQVGSQVRLAHNVWNGTMFHDVSTKERVAYIELVENTFIRCAHHCFEIGQNGNIPSRPSTTGIAVVRGNLFINPVINGLTQRYNRTLVVEGNTFRSAGGNVITSWPFWTTYTGSLNLIPEPPLRTIVRGNTFEGSNKMLFSGRGALDDVVLIKGNTGTAPTCRRGDMDSQDEGTAAAHSNVQTTAPPQLDPTSDLPCPA
jgi:hypothetical protein